MNRKAFEIITYSTCNTLSLFLKIQHVHVSISFMTIILKLFITTRYMPYFFLIRVFIFIKMNKILHTEKKYSGNISALILIKLSNQLSTLIKARNASRLGHIFSFAIGVHLKHFPNIFRPRFATISLFGRNKQRSKYEGKFI